MKNSIIRGLYEEGNEVMKKRKADKHTDKVTTTEKGESLSKWDRVRKVITPVFISLAVMAAVYLGVALTLVFTDAPVEHPVLSGGGVDFSEAVEADYSTLRQSST